MAGYRLTQRVSNLEQWIDPPHPKAWVRIFQYEGQTPDQAVAAWEVGNGPVGDRNVIMRVIVSKPFPAEGRPTGALCQL